MPVDFLDLWKNVDLVLSLLINLSNGYFFIKLVLFYFYRSNIISTIFGILFFFLFWTLYNINYTVGIVIIVLYSFVIFI